jgi:hypothetical protein
MSISKQTEFFLQQMSNGDVLMSVMSISEKTEVLFAANVHVLMSMMSISKKAKSFLQQMIMFIQV